MLVLHRKAGEAVIIAGTIEVTVLAIKGGGIKLGITAPDSISIVRKELLTLPPPPSVSKDSC